MTTKTNNKTEDGFVMLKIKDKDAFFNHPDFNKTFIPLTKEEIEKISEKNKVERDREISKLIYERIDEIINSPQMIKKILKEVKDKQKT